MIVERKDQGQRASEPRIRNDFRSHLAEIVSASPEEPTKSHHLQALVGAHENLFGLWIELYKEISVNGSNEIKSITETFFEHSP